MHHSPFGLRVALNIFEHYTICKSILPIIYMLISFVFTQNEVSRHQKVEAAHVVRYADQAEGMESSLKYDGGKCVNYKAIDSMSLHLVPQSLLLTIGTLL